MAGLRRGGSGVAAGFALALGLAGTAPAQTPAPYPSPTGARPGNEIGTGMSLPRSDRASNIGPNDTRSELAPNLPAPAGPEDLPDLLRSARVALQANATGAAQEALERAETRALDRSVPYGAQNVPDNGALVRDLAQARRALGAGDRAGAIAQIDRILAGLR